MEERTFTIFIFSSVILLTLRSCQSQECADVEKMYSSMGFSKLDVPTKTTSGEDLRICSHGYSCCTADMEMNLAERSRTLLHSALDRVTHPITQSLADSTAKLDEFIRSVMDRSEHELQVMFSAAYGVQYKQNEAVFKQLFTNFRSYYQGTDVDLSNTMKQFFTDVFRRMFVMQNPEKISRDTDDAYMHCVELAMSELKPFGSTPESLQRNVKQAFVAARTFVQGLAIGWNVVANIAEVEMTTNCTKAHTKMTLCAHCRGLPSLKPCNNYCLNVMRGCLAYHSELNHSWVNYIDALDELAVRLEGEGAFNIEAVLSPLEDTISSAIMEYHTNSRNISYQIFTKCGQPPSGNATSPKTKRAVTAEFGSRLRPKSSNQGSVTLNTLVRDIRSKMRQLKSLWINLPVTQCDSLSAPISSSKCWNGQDEARYTTQVMQDGVQANRNNPEVGLDISKPNSIIAEQLQQLNKITTRMNEAKLGKAVDWLSLDINISMSSLNISSHSQAEGIGNKQSTFPADAPISDNSVRLDGSGSDIELGSGSTSRLNAHDMAIVLRGKNDDEDLEGSGMLNRSSIIQLLRPTKTKQHGAADGYGSGVMDSHDGSGSGDVIRFDSNDDEDGIGQETVTTSKATTVKATESTVSVTQMLVKPARDKSTSSAPASKNLAFTVVLLAFIWLS